MADYIVIVTLDDPQGLRVLDEQLILSGFETTVEPQPVSVLAPPSAPAFVLPGGVYRIFTETTAPEVHDAVAGHLHRLKMAGAILVIEKAEPPVMQSGHARHDPNGGQAVRG